jgi:hypothetical protein
MSKRSDDMAIKDIAVSSPVHFRVAEPSPVPVRSASAAIARHSLASAFDRRRVDYDSPGDRQLRICRRFEMAEGIDLSNPVVTLKCLEMGRRRPGLKVIDHYENPQHGHADKEDTTSMPGWSALLHAAT